MKRLGGWWRLWIVLSVLYGLTLAGLAMVAWPDMASVDNTPEFFAAVQAVRDRVVAAPNVVAQRVQQRETAAAVEQNLTRGDLSAAAGRYLSVYRSDQVRIRLEQSGCPAMYPSASADELARCADSLDVVRELRVAQLPLLTASIDSAVTLIVEARRLTVIKRSMAMWLGPCILLMLLALAIQWVRAGFGSKSP